MFGKLNPFRSKNKSNTRKNLKPKKPDWFDPSPKMVANGTAYIVKLTMSVRMNKNQYACQNEQLIFSDNEVPNQQLLELPVLKKFFEENPDGLVEKTTFQCELKSVKNESITNLK